MRALLVVCWLTGIAGASPALDAVIKTAPGCEAKRARCFGIALHVATGETGPVATAEWVAGQLAGANRHFEPLDTEFRIVSVDALPAGNLRVEDRQERDSFAAQAKGRVLHVFVTGRLDDVDVAGNEIYGVAWRSTTEVKLIILSTQALERTLAHELGHVFGLPHSTYAISIMNKTARDEPPPEQRTFAPQELVAMKPRILYFARSKTLEDRR